MKTLRRKGTSVGERGAQLLELALVLPMLLVLVAGVVDFANAWNVRQILANAARDGARLGATQSTLDLTDTSPASIQAICQQVASYLVSEHVSLAFMNMSSSSISGGCASPGVVMGANSTGAPAAWTYYSTGTYGLKIERTVNVPSTCGGAVTCIVSTRVTLTYPYNWAFGFGRLVQLIGGSSYPSTISIQVYSTMADLAP